MSNSVAVYQIYLVPAECSSTPGGEQSWLKACQHKKKKFFLLEPGIINVKYNGTPK